MPNFTFDSLRRAVDTANQWDVYRMAIEQGYTPADIRSAVVDTLSPYFQNKDILERMAIDVLPAEAFRVASLDQDEWTKNLFLHTLNIYRASEVRDPQSCYQACADSSEDALAATSEHWSLLYLEVDKNELPLDELRHDVFRSIGAVVEALIQPHLKDLVAQVRISRGKQARYANFRYLELGKVVDELHSTLGYPEALAPAPWGIRLNQWRNIAHHHKTKILGDKVVGYYGIPPNEKEVVLDRNELVDVLRCMYSIFDALGLARTLFFIDSVESISPLLPEGLRLRVDARVLSLSTALNTQGFSLTNLFVDKDDVIATVYDITDQPPRERMIHASQFVFPVWRHFQRPTATVCFFDSKGHLWLTTTGKSEDCQAVADGTIDFYEMANRVDLEFNSVDAKSD